jgi:hypothetical protein
MMKTAECPNCDSLVPVGSTRIGTMVRCNTCHESLIVISSNPLELDWPFEDEDFDEEYGDEEEYDWEEDFEREEDGW